MAACERGDLETAKRLLKHGADVNERNENNECALFRAANRGHVEVTKLLLRYQANVNSVNKGSGDYSLITASESGHFQIVKLCYSTEPKLMYSADLINILL